VSRFIKKSLSLFCATLFALIVVVDPARADPSFPTKAVHIIVPQTPGGASDALARIIGQKLTEKWGQPVVIDNRPGAGGNVGMEVVTTSSADGYVLLMSYVGTQAINGALYGKLTFDPARDFAPVAAIATLPFVLVCRPDSPYRTPADVAQASKAGRVTFGSAGNGSVNHLLGEMFNTASGAKLDHVPYRGAAPAMTDLLGGQIDLVFTSLPSVAGNLKAGSLRAIAVTSEKRAASFSDIPSLSESPGFKGFDVNPWFGLMAPKNTPKDVIAKINRDVNELLRTKDVIDLLAQQGAEPLVISPDEFGKILAADVVKWDKVVKDSGAHLD
jgi:tripartite-type tricarboxylate transporter receptor subunit TctC